VTSAAPSPFMPIAWSKMSRPSWEEYFMEIARLVARRSTCLRRQVGAVVVKEKNILATGYNGTPSGIAHCSETGCLRQKLGVPSGERHELCRGLHAEQNAIIQAAKHGVNIGGGTLYCTNSPCVICSKMIINAGLARIVYLEGYPDSLSGELLRESGIETFSYAEMVRRATAGDAP
jgi:dCMP deaminase